MMRMNDERERKEKLKRGTSFIRPKSSGLKRTCISILDSRNWGANKI